MAVADSPVMRQYGEIKAQHPAALVMFRMGDFYELFGEDAVTAAGALQITLTRRRTAQEGDAGIPMCGVPYHAAEGYIGKLLTQGYTVALAEQLETPEEAKKRGGPSLVKRGVVRLYTPGTLTEEAYLEAKRPSLLCAVAQSEDPQRLALAWLDLSTGEVGVRGVGAAQLIATLASMPIGELVVQNLPQGVEGVLPRRVVQVQPQLFAPSSAEAALARAYKGVALQGLGLDEPTRIAALGAVVGYSELTQMGKLPPLRTPRIALANTHLQLDAATRKSLDLLESPSGQRADTVLGALDDTITSAGGRLLARWLSEPLAQYESLQIRQNAVRALMQNGAMRQSLRRALQPTGDVARAVSRLLLGRGSPRDLGTLRNTGQAVPEVLQALNATTEPLLKHHMQQLEGLSDVTALLCRALAPDPLPALVRDGGFVAEGFDAELDKLRHLQSHAHEMLSALEQREAESSKLNAKLRYNQVWGYYLEVGKTAGEIPSHWVHRQTTTNTHRYSTPELLQLERDVANAAVQAQTREEQVLVELLDAIRATTDAWAAASEGLATLDVLGTLAEVAVRNAWILPTLSDDSELKLIAAKHPVVAAKRPDFVANSVQLNTGDVWLLTGPNMAGKSTFLRQTALLVVLAQIGSAVPAAEAHVGLCDAIFCRVGAADNLAAGQSTFMVEMLETANILNRATARSLVILDELGRGTATYDGLAIAWAATEALTQRIKARTLFATHYHELAALTETLPQLSNHQLAVKVWKNELVFLHEVKPGAAEGSYGVQVAKLAGVPNEVVQRAQTLLQGFEASAKGNARGRVARTTDLSLFTAPTHMPQQAPSAVEDALRATDVDGLSPREALQVLYDLKAKVQAAPPAALKAVV